MKTTATMTEINNAAKTSFPLREYFLENVTLLSCPATLTESP